MLEVALVAAMIFSTWQDLRGHVPLPGLLEGCALGVAGLAAFFGKGARR